MNFRKRMVSVLLVFLLLAGILTGCGSKDSAAFRTLEDFQKAKIGIMTGSSQEGIVKERFPEAERVYYTSAADMILGVEQGKIDAYCFGSPFLTASIWEDAQVKRFAEPLDQGQIAFGFPKGEESRHLREQLNAFLQKAGEDGTLRQLQEKWLGDTEPAEHPDYESLTGENGTIRLAVFSGGKPLIYQYQNRSTGLEMELLTAFGREYGYRFQIEAVPLESVILGMASGKYDMAASSLQITAERAQSVDFSDPYMSFDVVMVVKDDGDSPAEETDPDYANGTIGVLMGSVFDKMTKEMFPNAQREYYNTVSDLILALSQGKIDGYMSEHTYITAAIWEGAKIRPGGEVLMENDNAFVFQKGETSAQLREQLDAYILSIMENGQLDTLREKWFGETEPADFPDYGSLTGENGTIRVAVAPDLKPITYVKDGIVTGFDMELLVGFAQEYGYDLDISMMNFEGILPGVTSGKYDIGTGAVTITEERKQSIAFSLPYLNVAVSMVVSAESDGDGPGFWEDLKTSFEKTFLREDRWKLILEGVGVTLLISLSAGLLGSLLGFGLYMLSRSQRKLLEKLARGIARVYSRIIAGTPVVVILMILFYVVFGNFRDISGVVVAIICFSLTFGAFVYDHLRVSVNSVDPGQTEAAYALGYTRNLTFFRVILPQAMSVFLPSYCGQAVELIKATAVVGYVAVNDLTKMGDIIRSNTYEAFFPLIATAVIYFVLTWVLSLLLGLVKKRCEPKRRTSEAILKGVKTV